MDYVNWFLGRAPLPPDVAVIRPSPEIREASHGLKNAVAELGGARVLLRREASALAELEKGMRGENRRP